MPAKTKTITSIQNDVFYKTLTDLIHKKRLDFADAYKIKQYLTEEDLKKTTTVDKRVIEYIHKNLKDWHTLVTNTNASKIFLILNENAKNRFNICKMLGLGNTTVHYWIGHLKKLEFITRSWSYGIEKMWRRDDLFEQGSDPDDLVKEKNQPPKDKLKLMILSLTAYFCMYMLRHKSVEATEKKIKEDFSFLVKPPKKDNFLSEE